jgi:enoyl-CoA hydratase/carnithine racemase
VLHPDELMPAAIRLAEEIAAHTSPVSVALNRQLIWRMLGQEHPMAANIAESRAMYQRGLGPDATEGVASFLERRPARFTQAISTDLPDIFAGLDEPVFTP